MTTYVITQASGIQAQWTIHSLLEAGAKVHAIVRNPSKIPSHLERPGITLFQGDNNNSEAVFKAAQGCKGVFLNTFPAFDDISAEGRQVKTVLEACKRAGVEHVVASTSCFTSRRDMWETAEASKYVGNYYLSKTRIEDAVRGAGLKSYTIVRPSFIHRDFHPPHVYGNFPSLPKNGELAHGFNDGAKMVYVSEHDVGKYAAAALQDPAKFDKQEIELGNEHLTIEEVQAILVRVTGKNIPLRKMTGEEIEIARNTVPGLRFQLFASLANLPDTTKETVEKFGIPFSSFEEYVKQYKAEIVASLPAQA
jgi:nucleoside-diphosphate-sugar epimerase